MAIENNIIVIKINNEAFLLQAPHHLDRQQKIWIESLLESAWEDNGEELFEKSDYELLDWILAEIFKGLGLKLANVGIDCEFNISTP